MTKPKIRVLDPDEHGLLVGLGPFKDRGPDPAGCAVVVAEDDHGRVIGYWCAFNAVHLEPLWVAEAERDNGVGMAMWAGLRQLLDENGVANAFAMVADEDVMTHLPLAAKLGFQRIPVSILFISLNEGGTEGLILDNTGKEGH